MSTLVMKFGGASVGAAPALSQVLKIIAREAKQWDRVLLVVSALDGVTDMLLDAAQLARIANQRGYRRIVGEFAQPPLRHHGRTAAGRPRARYPGADIDQLLSEMLDHCLRIARSLNAELSPLDSDAVIAVGERLSARIIAALLRQNGLRSAAVDGTGVLVTDDVFGNANPDLHLTARRVDLVIKPMLQRDIIPVVTGFIGATANGETTTLGRGGADYTASVLGALLEADELWLWTDVAGMMSADPRALATARVIPSLTYAEATDLAYFGARILHARMLAPLAQGALPLRIKNIASPEQTGTLVSSAARADKPILKAVTSTQGLSLRRPGQRLTGRRDALGRQHALQNIGDAQRDIDRVAVVQQQFLMFGDTHQHRPRQRRPPGAGFESENGGIPGKDALGDRSSWACHRNWRGLALRASASGASAGSTG